MSLLNNLLEFSNMQSTSLFFCESPKDSVPRPKELKQLLSARKEDEVTPEKRMASKSLTKMNLFSGAKVDPKERLLHRMVHKLEMKRRKYYYNFFVVLENLKKNNVYRCVPPAKTTPQMSVGLAKLDQIAEILRLKYFDSALKKAAWRGISDSARDRWAIGRLIKVINRCKTAQFLKQMVAYSKKLEKEEMRLEILAASIKTIEIALKKYYRFSLL